MLTEREKEVLELMADGFSNDEIATQLFISPATAKCHMFNIYQKLGFTQENRNSHHSVVRVRAVLWYLKNKDKINE